MLRQWFLTNGMGLAARIDFPVAKAVKLLGESQYWTETEIKTHQSQALNALMRHCYDHVPYYRDVMKERGLTPHDFQTVEDLAKLPYLTRDTIRQQAGRLRADNYPDTMCQFRRSGGTTGEPIQVAVDAGARALEVAAYLRGFQWMKYQFGRPMVRLFGGSLGLNQDVSLRSRAREWLFNGRFLPAFELTLENVAQYVDTISRARGGVLVGYASAMRNLAEYMTQQNLRVTSLESVICTAEYTPPQWRSYIGRALGAPVFCYYGCGEVNSIGYECSGEEGYVITQEHVVLEVANSNSEQFCNTGQGEACVTTLFNYAMPLVRYLNGDVLEITPPRQGRAHARITQLEGRVVDQLLRRDGSRISGALVPHMVFRSGFPAWKYQVVQTDPDRIAFHYMLRQSEKLSADMKDKLVDVFRRHLGSDVQVHFVPGEFETTRSRKHRFVINKLLTTSS